jgi:hypothetical protein
MVRCSPRTALGANASPLGAASLEPRTGQAERKVGANDRAICSGVSAARAAIGKASLDQ